MYTKTRARTRTHAHARDRRGSVRRYLGDVLGAAQLVDELVERVGRQAAAQALDGQQQLLLHAARALDGRAGRRLAARWTYTQHALVAHTSAVHAFLI